MSHKQVGKKEANEQSNKLSKPKTASKSSTVQNPAATVKLSEDKSTLKFNPEHVKSAKAKHLASNGQQILRHPGADEQHSQNIGTLNQE